MGLLVFHRLFAARDAEHVAKSIVDAVLPPFSLEQELGFVSASIAIYPNDTTDQKQLLKHADQAMYIRLKPIVID
ncbi:MAG: diguanylate cyclase domain-containing protein [Methylomonas sp.]